MACLTLQPGTPELCARCEERLLNEPFRAWRYCVPCETVFAGQPVRQSAADKLCTPPLRERREKAFLARRVSPDVSAATPDPALFGYAPLRRSPFFICSNLHQTALPRRAFPCAAALFLPGKGECASRRVQESGRPYCSAHHAAMAACAFFTSRPKIARLFSIFAPGQSF